MHVMGLPALKERFESLTAVTRTRSEDVSRASEVVSITMATLVRAADNLVDTISQLRVLFISGGREISELFEGLEKDEKCANDIANAAMVMAMMRRFASRIDRPYLADVDGKSLISAADAIEKMRTHTAGDGRLTRRLGKRIREAGDDCDKQRLRFVERMQEAQVTLNRFVENHFDQADFRREYANALAKQSIDRFPVVNAYLAS